MKRWVRYGVSFSLAGVLIAGAAWVGMPYRRVGEWVFQQTHAPHHADVIVVLFGDARQDGQAVGRETHRRISYGVRLFQAGYADMLLFSGGRPDGANLMAKLAQELGVAPKHILIENRSHDTVSNWTNSAALIAQRGWTSALLVSSAFHVARAMRIVRSDGITIYPAAVPYHDSDPLYARHEIRHSFFHNAGAYLFYRCLGSQRYETVVEYLRSS